MPDVDEERQTSFGPENAELGPAGENGLEFRQVLGVEFEVFFLFEILYENCVSLARTLGNAVPEVGDGLFLFCGERLQCITMGIYRFPN